MSPGPLAVLAPVPWRVVAMADVPDPVFAQSIVGPGLAVEPSRGVVDVVAPVAGTIVKLHPHAFVLVTAQGRGVLVHLGIDTVQLAGRGFELLATEGDVVTAGQVLVRFDVDGIVAGGRSPVVPVVALDVAPHVLDDLHPVGDVGAGDVLFTVA